MIKVCLVLLNNPKSPSLKLTVRTCQEATSKGNDHLPTIHFQVLCYMLVSETKMAAMFNRIHRPSTQVHLPGCHFYQRVDMGVSKNRGTPKWMIYMEIPIKMDDLGVPPFSETPIWVDHFSLLQIFRFSDSLDSCKQKTRSCSMPQSFPWQVCFPFFRPMTFLSERTGKCCDALQRNSRIMTPQLLGSFVIINPTNMSQEFRING